MKRLNELFDVESDIKIYSIHSDSRYVKPYSVFFCIEGLSVDGHQYVEDAIFQGAKCIVHSKELPYYQSGITYVQVEDTLDELNRVSNIFYDYPSKKMKIVGITGTSGKTIVALMVKNALAKYCKTGYIGTISLEYDEVIEESPYTTPETLFLQRHLYDMEKRGVKVVAMETSSHGLYLKRVDSIYFDIAVLTHIGEEHLDFHGTKEYYIASKQILFERLSKQGHAIINNDDDCASRIKEHTNARILTYGITKEADIMAKNIHLTLHNTAFDLYFKGNMTHVTTPMIGDFNVYNMLAMVGVMIAIGCDERMIIDAIENIDAIPGRMEVIKSKYGFTTIIDYCQSVKNYEDVFRFVNQTKSKQGRLIAVFGAPGKRNIKNRIEIGKLANTYCDHVILTEMDDRGEDVEDICHEIQEQLVNINSVIITRRQIAIEQAIELACKDDVILILGKGHEQFIALSVGEADYPGDKQVVLDSMERIYNKGEEDDELQ